MKDQTLLRRYQCVQQATRADVAANTATPQEFFHLLLGLTGEAGEAADVIKKMTWLLECKSRKELMKAFSASPKSGDYSYARLFIDELGDTLWYMVQLCVFMGITLEDLAAINHDKLAQRHKVPSVEGLQPNDALVAYSKMFDHIYSLS